MVFRRWSFMARSLFSFSGPPVPAVVPELAVVAVKEGVKGVEGAAERT